MQGGLEDVVGWFVDKLSGKLKVREGVALEPGSRVGRSRHGREQGAGACDRPRAIKCGALLSSRLFRIGCVCGFVYDARRVSPGGRYEQRARPIEVPHNRYTYAEEAIDARKLKHRGIFLSFIRLGLGLRRTGVSNSFGSLGWAL